MSIGDAFRDTLILMKTLMKEDYEVVEQVLVKFISEDPTTMTSLLQALSYTNDIVCGIAVL